VPRYGARWLRRLLEMAAAHDGRRRRKRLEALAVGRAEVHANGEGRSFPKASSTEVVPRGDIAQVMLEWEETLGVILDSARIATARGRSSLVVVSAIRLPTMQRTVPCYCRLWLPTFPTSTSSTRALARRILTVRSSAGDVPPETPTTSQPRGDKGHVARFVEGIRIWVAMGSAGPSKPS
jgi:hypothetical protein